MAEKIFFVLYWAANLMALTCTVFSFLIGKRKTCPIILRSFYWYFLISSLFTIFFELHRFGVLISFPYYESLLFYAVFHFSFLSVFIIRVTGGLNANKKIGIVFLLFQLMMCIAIYFDLANHKYYTGTVANVGLIFFGIYYYFSLFKDQSELNLFINPYFFAVSGILISSVLITPVLLFFDLIRKEFSQNISYAVSSIAPFSSLILYMLIIKAFLCIKRQPKV